jgi:hypothetical protein
MYPRAKTTPKRRHHASRPADPAVQQTAAPQASTAKEEVAQEKQPDLSQWSGKDLDRLIRNIEVEKNRRADKVEPPEGCNTELTQLSDEVLQERESEAIAELEKRIDPIVAERLRTAGEKLQQDFAPILSADLPEVPHGNLQQLSNEKLDQLTLEVERRITGFTEFYANLDRKQSEWVRAVLDAERHSLQEERAARGLPPLPARIEASPPATMTDAAKKEPARNAASAETTKSNFSPSNDYRTVTLGDKMYALTPGQARIVQILHEAYKSGKPNVSIYSIMEQTPDSRWQDTFKRNPDAQKALIRMGATKGSLRLNL